MIIKIRSKGGTNHRHDKFLKKQLHIAAGQELLWTRKQTRKQSEIIAERDAYESPYITNPLISRITLYHESPYITNPLINILLIGDVTFQLIQNWEFLTTKWLLKSASIRSFEFLISYVDWFYFLRRRSTPNILCHSKFLDSWHRWNHWGSSWQPKWS